MVTTALLIDVLVEPSRPASFCTVTAKLPVRPSEAEAVTVNSKGTPVARALPVKLSLALVLAEGNRELQD